MEAVPPLLYGGTERIVAYLTEELVRQGHAVTLFASGDSRTQARLIPCAPWALRLHRDGRDSVADHTILLDEVRRRASQFDILHFHVDLLHFPIFRDMAGRTVTTLHGRLDLPQLARVYCHFPDFPLVSISDAQRRPMPPANWAGTVHHGLPTELLQLQAQPKGDYLAFLGRISPEKRPDRAIEIALQTQLPLRIAAKIDAADRDYFTQRIQPLLKHPLITYLGEISEAEKGDFLGNARALLFPVDWPEPFGLVLIEAMACGTPVIAFRCGAVPEIVEEGRTGFIVENLQQAAQAVQRLKVLDRREIRHQFEQRFSAKRMAKNYLAIYRELTLTSECHIREVKELTLEHIEDVPSGVGRVGA
jgi:glycosyltransferase involved in cell wall biosynthesis